MEMASSPRTVEDIFKDYSGRRAGVLRALTSDFDEFYGQCDPDKENLCLYGHPNESWEVTPPEEEVPPELPEPALGINFARDGMDRKDWLSLVAVHSDSWLLSVAFCLGASLNRNERKHLFNLINDLPTVFEVVMERKPTKNKPSVDSGSKSRGNTTCDRSCDLFEWYDPPHESQKNEALKSQCTRMSDIEQAIQNLANVLKCSNVLITKFIAESSTNREKIEQLQRKLEQRNWLVMVLAFAMMIAFGLTVFISCRSCNGSIK